MEEAQTERRQWMMFDCPFCKEQMVLTRQRASRNERGQRHIVTLYACEQCDYKQKTTVGRNLAATVVEERFLPVEEPAPA